jgi:hypothetical protein
MTRYFKILVDGKSCHGGNSTWSLPEGDKPGDWMPKLTKIEPCVRGYHIVEAYQILQWLKKDCQIFEVEVYGKVISRDDDKHVCGKVRLVKQMKWDSEVYSRLFAADCAEHVLHIYEKNYPDDNRPRKAIEAVRKSARKEIDAAARAWDAARAAARDAAGAAAGAAARAAARAAAGARAWDAARAAAGDAARDAARDAAGAAARDAARAAARDAAWAWDAAGDAARAWDAARDAAGAAAGAAARAAEQQWQGQRLLQYLDGEVE